MENAVSPIFLMVILILNIIAKYWRVALSPLSQLLQLALIEILSEWTHRYRRPRARYVALWWYAALNNWRYSWVIEIPSILNFSLGQKSLIANDNFWFARCAPPNAICVYPKKIANGFRTRSRNRALSQSEQQSGESGASSGKFVKSYSPGYQRNWNLDSPVIERM